MNKSKKMIIWLMMMIMILSLVGCGDEKEIDSDDENGTRVESVNESDVKDETDPVEESEVASSDEATGKETSTKAQQKLIAKDILDKMVEACQGKTITKTNMLLDIEYGMVLQGVSYEAEMSMEGNTNVSLNPYKAYSNISIDFNFMGQNQMVCTESYVVEENGTFYTYTNSDDTGWTKVDSGLDVEEMEQALSYGMSWLKEKEEKDISVDEEIYEINGKKAYKLSVALKGSEMQQVLGNMYGTSDFLTNRTWTGADLSNVNTLCSYYVDIENFQILKIEADIEGYDKVLTDIYKESYANEEGAEETEIEVYIDKCHIIYDNVSYDPVEIPELPEEALAINESLGVDEFASGEDNVYYLEEGENNVEITCPEGWQLYSREDHTLILIDDEQKISVIYSLYSNVTSEDVLIHIEENEVPNIKAMDIYESHKKVDVVDNYETVLLDMSKGIMTFAWTPVGDDGMLYVVISDTVNESIEDSLAPVLETIKW